MGKVPRYVPTYLPREKGGEERRGEERRDGGVTRVKCGLSVNSEIYEAFLRVCPHRAAHQVLEKLMVDYILEQSKRPDIVIEQSLNQFIKAEPHSTVNIVNKIEANPVRERALEWASLCLKNWHPWNYEAFRRGVKKWGEKDPEVLHSREFKELMRRLEEAK
jgi:hypothetical protein